MPETTLLRTKKDRSSHTEVFFKKEFLRNFTKLTGKHLCQSLSFNKIAGSLKPERAQVFSCEFCKICKNTFFIEYLWWLILKKIKLFRN